MVRRDTPSIWAAWSSETLRPIRGSETAPGEVSVACCMRIHTRTLNARGGGRAAARPLFIAGRTVGTGLRVPSGAGGGGTSSQKVGCCCMNPVSHAELHEKLRFTLVLHAII